MHVRALVAFAAGSLIVVCQASQGAPAPTPAGDQSIQAWALTQKSVAVGTVQVWVSPTYLKLVEPSTSLTLVSCAPDWQVVVYNSRARSVMRSPLSKFTGFSRLGLAITRQFYTDGIPVSKMPGTVVICGQPASVYQSSESFAKRAKEFSDSHYKTDTGAIVSARLLTARAWKLPKEEGIILSRFFAIPDMPELPLYYECVDRGGRKTEVLSTSSCKKVTLSLAQFAIPKDFRPVASMEAVRVDNAGEAGIENMLQVIDGDLSKKRK